MTTEHDVPLAFSVDIGPRKMHAHRLDDDAMMFSGEYCGLCAFEKGPVEVIEPESLLR